MRFKQKFATFLSAFLALSLVAGQVAFAFGPELHPQRTAVPHDNPWPAVKSAATGANNTDAEQIPATEAHSPPNNLADTALAQTPAGPAAKQGRILFGPVIDTDGNPASNPVQSAPVPIVDLLGHRGSIIMLAAQLEADNPRNVPINVPVTFNLWQNGVLVRTDTVMSDAWGAAGLEIPLTNLDGDFTYEATAPGFGTTETRAFRFDQSRVSHIMRPDGADLSYVQDGNQFQFTLTSPVALEAGRDEIMLAIMRRPGLDEDAFLARSLPAGATAVGLEAIPLPDIFMRIVDAHTAEVTVHLPEGDYGMVASLLVNTPVVEQFYSQPIRLAVYEAETPRTAVVWAAPLEYETGHTLVQYAGSADEMIYGMLPTADVPEIDEAWDGQNQLVKVWRTGPFEWEEAIFDVDVETIVTDGKKVAVLESFDYDPVSRSYHLAIKSLQNTTITDTLTVEVLGPGDIVLQKEVSQVVLEPNEILRYTVEVPAGLGKPAGLIVTLDDPLIEKLQELEASVSSLYNAVSGSGTVNGFIRLYADIFNVELITYTFRYPPGSHEFEFPLFEELSRDPWEVLVRLGGEAFSSVNFNLFGSIWGLFRGKDLDEILADLFYIEIGGLGIDFGAEVGFEASADFGDCPEDADVQELEDRLAEIADRLDRVVSDAIDFTSPSLGKIPLHAIVAVKIRIRIRAGGSVTSSGLTMRITANGSIGATGRVSISIGFGFSQAAWFLVANKLTNLINRISYWVDVVNIINEVINIQIPNGDCDPDPPDPRPPDDRQDVWQGVETFYEGETFEETTDNLNQLIQRADNQGLDRASRLLTLRLREAELEQFNRDRTLADDYFNDTLDTMDATDIALQDILSGTTPISPTLTLTEALTIRYLEGWDLIENHPYARDQRTLIDAVDVAQRRYLELLGQELELQMELQKLFTAQVVGVVATGFAESTLSALAAQGIPSQLVSPWPGDGDFRGQPSPYLPPQLAPRAMVVPSGGLHTLANSAGARDWLDRYVASGGLLVVFTQAFGSDWEALPGGEVRGVGYEEDQRWQHATVQATQPSDWLVWMGIEKPDVQIDGAFTAWPSDANLLLTRTFGPFAGQPVLIEYPHGAGTVLATSAYGDWAWSTNFWWGDDARFTHSILIRAYLLATGRDIGDIAAADPADVAGVTVTLTNTAPYTATSIRAEIPLVWGRGSSSSVAEGPVNIGPNDGGSVALSIPTPPVRRNVHDWTQVGLYRTKVQVKAFNGTSYNVWGPFVYVRSPVVPPSLSGALRVDQSPASPFSTVNVSATIRNLTSSPLTAVISDQVGLPVGPVTLTVPAEGTATHIYPVFMDSSKELSAAYYDDAGKLLNRSSVVIPLAYPDLRATPIIPVALSDGTPIPVRILNRASQGQALAASLALSMTTPSGAVMWSDTVALPPIAAGETVTVPVTHLGAATELGIYRLWYVVDDGISLSRRSYTPVPSRITLDTDLDRATYRIRESGLVTAVLTNDGNFDLAPALTVSSTAVALTAGESLLLPVGASESRSYGFTLPDTLPAGSHPLDIRYQVGTQIVSRTERIVVLPARLRPVHDQDSYTLGETIVVTIENSGGVDAPISGTLAIADIYGTVIASVDDTPTALAGDTTVFSLLIPNGAVSGDYFVTLNGRNTDTDQPLGLRREITIAGIGGNLTVQTDLPAYFADEDITALATLLATAAPINDGTLDLKICRVGPTLGDEGDPPPPTPSPTPPPEGAPIPAPGPEHDKGTLSGETAPSGPAPNGLQVVTYTQIAGSPLSINVANDGSYQVLHDSVVETPGQVYWTLSDIADAGLFVWFQNYVIGPDFNNHPDGSASNSYDAWAGTGQSGVMGNGTPVNPWVVETNLIHPPSGVSLTSQSTYVDGADFFRIDWEVCAPDPMPTTAPEAVNLSTFIAADYYLQGSDNGFGLYDPESGSVGGFNAALDWFQIFTPITPADHYYEARYWEIWNAIGFAGNPGPGFPDTINPALIDNGAGLQWDATVDGCESFSTFWSFGDTPTIPPVEPPFQEGCGFVLWETEVPVNTATQLDVAELVGTLEETGQLVLWGQASSSTGQPFAEATYPFYIHDRDTALTLETDKPVYRPGTTVEVSGVVTNTTLLTQTFTLSVTANSGPLLATPLELGPGEAHLYSTSLAATEPLSLTAEASNALVAVYPIVANPGVGAVLDVPAVVGRDAFSATLTISNTGIVSAAVQGFLPGVVGPPVVLEPGQATAVATSLQITADSVVTGTVGGDVPLILTQPVLQGANAAFNWLPVAAELAGRISVPYQILGLGTLPTDGNLVVTLDGAPAAIDPFGVVPGTTRDGTLLLDISPGRHVVAGSLQDGNGVELAQASQTIVLLDPNLPADPEPEVLGINVTPNPALAGGDVTVDVEVGNSGGGGPVIISIQLFGPPEQIIVDLDEHDEQIVSFVLPVPPDLPVDDYFGEVIVDGQGTPFTVGVTGIDIAMSLALDQVSYLPGEVATLTVTLTDLAGITGDYLVMPRYLVAEDYMTVTVPANGTVLYTFPFTTTEAARINVFLATPESPPLFDRRVLLLDSLPVPVIQPSQGATLSFDKLVYGPGETANITLNISGTLGSVIVMGPMELTFQEAQFLFFNAPFDPDPNGAGLTLQGTYPLSYTFPAITREGRHTFWLRIDGEVYEYPVDVTGWKVTTRHIEVDKARYAQQDELTARVEFWNEGDDPINGLVLTGWLFLPDDEGVIELTPVVSRSVDLVPGLNEFDLGGAFDSPAVGPHRLLVNLSVPGTTWRVAGAAAQFDVGWAHIVGLTTDQGAYAPGEPGTGRLDVYGFGPTQLLVTASEGSTLLDTTVVLNGFETYSFTIPTAVEGDYLLIGRSTDRDGGENEIITPYAVPGAQDIDPPQLTLTSPQTYTVITSAAPTTTVVVSGTVVDDSPVTVLVNGNPVTPTVGGNFSTTFPVDQGYNIISAVAIDEADNIGFAPVAAVLVVPDREVTLAVDQTVVGVGQLVEYTAVLTASGPITQAALLDLLPATLVTDVVAVASSGLVTVTDTALIWQGDVAAGTPVVIDIAARTTASGFLTNTVSAFWGLGLINVSNTVETEIVVGVSCEVYPIALDGAALDDVAIGDMLNILHGGGPGNFGWMSWTGSNSANTLANSLTPPGDSDTYVNPFDPNDPVLSAGDWVEGVPGRKNSKKVRNALDALEDLIIVVPVWDSAEGSGNNLNYHVVGFALVEITKYKLSGKTPYINAVYRGPASCGG